MEKEEEIEECSTACFHLVSAFLACEPPDFVISFARDFGGGFITERVQSFLWNECINKSDVKCNLPYLKRFLKKLIVEIESNGDVVLDELYEKYIFCLASVKVMSGSALTQLDFYWGACYLPQVFSNGTKVAIFQWSARCGKPD
ncbi:hypothetical protein T459_25137 [Capsicum annuum]|uniref:Uncharacterized protein n=1 Tax=Capsicum annuum TaxID=4072 RepID=A0A2G2YJW9_CAPAN|nr:hypothetical protein T459_25137 [Capsicum annuum]